MLCQKCQKRIANFLVTQVINNQETDIYLCNECAYLSEGMNINIPSVFDDLVSNIIGFDANITRKYMEDVKEINVCEKCGMSYQEFKKNGKLGCENCYESFYEMLIPVIKRIQKNSKHIGKFPSKLKGKIVLDKEKEILKLKLKEAITKEQYELAAEIRDKIREMEGNL